RPAETQELEAELAQLKREQDYAASRKWYDEAKVFEKRIQERKEHLEQITERWQQTQGSKTEEVRVEDIAEAVARLASHEAGFVTGTVVSVNGGWRVGN
ncbi:SDR family oxidoreductase, partial [Acinetobacter baumannii]